MDSSDGHRDLARRVTQLGQLLAHPAPKSGTRLVAADGFVGRGRDSVVAVVAHGDQFWTTFEWGRLGRLTIRAGMPLLGRLFSPADAGPLVIPVATSIPVAFRVYYTPGYPPLLPDDLREAELLHPKAAEGAGGFGPRPDLKGGVIADPEHAVSREGLLV